jgi:glycosyltransferase involved in cell wall biosynthesis
VVVLSHGLEARSWLALRDRARRNGRQLSLKSRVAVPLTLVSQANYSLRHADQLLVLSTVDAEHLTGVLRVSPKRVKRMNSGVGEAFARLPRRPATRIRSVLFVGSWIDRKGCPELVKAWSDLSPRHPELRLTVAGTGLTVDHISDAFPAGVRDTVTVRPEVHESQLLDLLAAADLFVLPSWFEGMPLSLLEAAAAGLPCIATEVCGILDFIRPGRDELDGGILIPPHSADALVTAIEQLVNDPERAARIGRCARERAEAFTWRHTAVQALVAYRAAVTESWPRDP